MWVWGHGSAPNGADGIRQHHVGVGNTLGAPGRLGISRLEEAAQAPGRATGSPGAQQLEEPVQTRLWPVGAPQTVLLTALLTKSPVM